MKNLLTHRRNLVVPALLGCGVCALAQSLGNPVADAWIGQPLEVTIPARLSPADTGDGCVQAQVAYGDTHLRPDQIRTTVLGTEQQRRVRVQASAPINEPVVTVTLRAGCTNSVTRSYTLLPDMAADSVQSANASAVAIPVASPIASSGRVPALTAAPLRSLRASTVLGAPRARAARREPLAAAPRLQPASGGAELRTELRTTTTLSALGDAARSATARLLWQAINADPQELMRSTANLQRLERELVQLRSTAGQTRTEMAELRRSLDRAQPWYASAYTAQILSLLVLAAAAATALFAWRSRSRSEPVWFEQAPAPGVDTAVWDPAFGAAQGEELPSPVPAQKQAVQPQVVRPATRSPLAEPAVAARTEAPQPVARETPREHAPLAFDLAAGAPVQPRRAPTGVLRVETLAATFEEVEFLASLGLDHDAMDVLKAYVEDSAGPAPLAYFELMRLCARDDAATAEAVRRRYAQVFRVDAPRVDQVTAPLGLEANKALSERITRSWGTDEALQVIEDALFDVRPPAAPLTLQAGRDLLSLHDLAMGLAGEALPERDSHALAPWALAEDSAEAAVAAKAVAEAVGGRHFALDVDLGAAPEPLPETVLQPDTEEIAARLRAEKEAARQAFARKLAEEEDAFSAAMASERVPASRY
jgi:pilus assembly protein FimV